MEAMSLLRVTSPSHLTVTPQSGRVINFAFFRETGRLAIPAVGKSARCGNTSQSFQTADSLGNRYHAPISASKAEDVCVPDEPGRAGSARYYLKCVLSLDE